MHLAIKKGLARLRFSAAHFNRIAKMALHEILQGVLFFGGMAAVAYGAWMIYRPLGPIVGGLIAVWVSFLLAGEK